MMQRMVNLASLTILFVCATQLFAHDEFRIIGTITKIQNSQLEVKNREGKVYSMKVNTETYIHRDKEKERVPASELKTGRSVVVDALGDTEADLVAVEIRIVPPIASSTAK